MILCHCFLGGDQSQCVASRSQTPFSFPHKCTIAPYRTPYKPYQEWKNGKSDVFPPLASRRIFCYPNRRHGAGSPPRDPRFPITPRKPGGFKLENSNIHRPITQCSSSSINAAKRIRGIQVLDFNNLALIIQSLGS